MTLKKMMIFKDCPFCGVPAPDDLIDSLYPSGIYYRIEPEGWYSYHSHSNRNLTDIPMYKYVCKGCEVEMSGHSKEEVLSKWNSRVK